MDFSKGAVGSGAKAGTTAAAGAKMTTAKEKEKEKGKGTGTESAVDVQAKDKAGTKSKIAKEEEKVSAPPAKVRGSSSIRSEISSACLHLAIFCLITADFRRNPHLQPRPQLLHPARPLNHLSPKQEQRNESSNPKMKRMKRPTLLRHLLTLLPRVLARLAQLRQPRLRARLKWSLQALWSERKTRQLWKL
jgi:hypothetical protein